MSQSHVINPWPRFRIGDVARVQSGYAFKSEWFVPEGVRLLRNVNVSQGRVVWDDPAFFPPNRRDEFSTFELSEGDIVLSLDRPVVSGGLKVARIAERDLPALLLQRVGRFIVRAEVLPDYLYFFLQSVEFIRAITSHDQSLGVPHVSPRQVEDVELPLPPLAEQRRIAGRLREQLAEVANARTAVQAQLAAAQAFPAALLRDVFDHPDNCKREIKRLGEALRDIEAGKCMSCVERRAEPNEWGVLKVSAVTWGIFRPEENKVLPPDFVVPTEHEVQPGDFLISRSNTTELVGAVVLVRETRPKLMLSDKTLRLVLNEDVVAKEYLEWALRTSRCRDFIEQNSTGTSGSMKNITQDSIRNIPLALPTLDEQRTIAARLAAELAEVTRLRESLSGKLEALDRLPAALLAQAFQGGL